MLKTQYYLDIPSIQTASSDRQNDRHVVGVSGGHC